jgi:diguanylate cyclase (GGDEF)-like protein
VLTDPARLRPGLLHVGLALLLGAGALAYANVGERGTQVVFVAASVVPAIAIRFGLRRYRMPAVPWHLLTAGLLVLAVPHLLRLVDPSFTEAAMYGPLRDLCMALGYLGILVGSAYHVVRLASHDPGGIIDSALTGVSGAVVLWELVLRPRLLAAGAGTGSQLTVLFEVLIIMSLLGTLVRIIATTARARGSLYYLVAAAANCLIAILASAVTKDPLTGAYAEWVNPIWLAAYLSTAGAALHPSVAYLSRPERTVRDDLSPWRLARVGLILLVTPLVAGFSHFYSERPDALVIALASMVTIPLVLIRFWQLAAQRLRAERALAHQAGHDELTGLPNRRTMLGKVETALERRGTAPAAAVAVLFCDLDGFKPINDTLGHEAGDQVLRTVGRRLGGCVRNGDVVGRFGGDEFLILCPGAGEQEARQIMDRIEQKLSEPILLSGDAYSVGASVGLAVVGGASPMGADELIAAADAAMYDHKRSRRSAAR